MKMSGIIEFQLRKIQISFLYFCIQIPSHALGHYAQS